MLRAGAEQLRLAAVALAAHRGDRLQARRRGAVVAVTVVAGGRGEVPLGQERLGVDALTPAGVLREGNRLAPGQGVPLHAAGIFMATAARFRHLRGVDGRPRVCDGLDAVGAVAVGARRHLVVAPLQRLAVPARPILALLVHAGPGVEALHVDGIRVAARAERRSRLPVGSAPVRVRLEATGHRGLGILGQGRGGIASVAVLTRQPRLGVNVVGELRDGPARGRVPELVVAVAGDTRRGRRLWLGSQGQGERERQRYERGGPHGCPPPARPRPARQTKTQTTAAVPSTT